MRTVTFVTNIEVVPGVEFEAVCITSNIKDAAALMIDGPDPETKWAKILHSEEYPHGYTVVGTLNGFKVVKFNGFHFNKPDGMIEV